MSLLSKIQNLINAGNDVTGNDDENLTAVMQSLIGGYDDGSVRYTVSYSLSHISSSNNNTIIKEGRTYITTLTPYTDYTVDDVIVTMGGIIVADAYDDLTGIVAVANVSGNISITATSHKANLYKSVTWLFNNDTPLYEIGETSRRYQGWCRHNLQYDEMRDRFIFVQQHSSKHGSGAVHYAATMHIIDPSDVLKKTQIQIPEILGIANLVILPNGDYLLYPKLNVGKRYKSTDGGTNWIEESLTITDQHHLFGVYYCNGEFYAGCDSVWGEYHHSTDGLTWETCALDWTDENGCHTKEHSFCYWNGHVYAFGRRDFYVDDDASKGLVEDYNSCAVVFRLDNGSWTMIDDESLLAFQSNCEPYVFDDCIAIVHINRDSSNVLLNYSLYDGEDFTTVQTWSNLCLPSNVGAFTTPCIAFGDEYACIAFCTYPTIIPLEGNGYDRAINSVIIGATSNNKTIKKYFEYYRTGYINFAKMFHLTPEKLAFFPSGIEESIEWKWKTSNYTHIVNTDVDTDAYVYVKDYNNAMKSIDDRYCYLVKDEKFVRPNIAYGNNNNDVAKNWIFPYNNKWYAVGGKGGTDYTGVYAANVHQFVLEIRSFIDNPSIQPTESIAGCPDGVMMRKVAKNNGELANLNDRAYIAVYDIPIDIDASDFEEVTGET